MQTPSLNASKLIFSGTASRRGRNISVTPGQQRDGPPALRAHHPGRQRAARGVRDRGARDGAAVHARRLLGHGRRDALRHRPARRDLRSARLRRRGRDDRRGRSGGMRRRGQPATTRCRSSATPTWRRTPSASSAPAANRPAAISTSSSATTCRPGASCSASRARCRATGPAGLPTSTRRCSRSSTSTSTCRRPRSASSWSTTTRTRPNSSRIVRDGDAVLMPSGYHPNVAAPGHGINFIWMMAAHTRGRGPSVRRRQRAARLRTRIPGSRRAESSAPTRRWTCKIDNPSPREAGRGRRGVPW